MLKGLFKLKPVNISAKNKKADPDLELFISKGGLLRFQEGGFEESYYRGENTSNTIFDAHYVYHPAWAARMLKQTNPVKHIDISSTLHFCSVVSAFIPVEFYDFRPAPLTLSQLYCGRADLTNLEFETNSINSLSCMHTVEHIGLGRYGDPIDTDGDLKAIGELKRVLRPGGNLLFVVPVGQSKLVFHAHRIYSYDMVMNYFEDLVLKDFTLVDDQQGYHSPATKQLADRQAYGCGCFWFQKPLT